MSILFVLLTFLLIMSITYFLRHGEQPAQTLQPRAFPSPPQPRMSRELGFEVPQGYCFHPGHMWVLDEGRQNARIGLDNFGAMLLGKINRVEVVGLNRWVRQGQKVATLTHDGISVDVLSPVEGVVISVNHNLQQDPSLLMKDPYKEGWICVVKAPEISTNLNNLLRGPMITPWMQNSLRRLTGLTSQLGLTATADGGVPVAGILTHLEPAAQRALVHEFFLT